MKKLKMIYNPNAGDKTLKYNLDACISVFQQAGYETHVFRTIDPNDIDAHFGGFEKNYYDAVVVCGGDGTVNLCVNAMKIHGHDMPLGIIPSGTANDFATFLKIPQEHAKAAEVIAKGKVGEIDLGLVNDTYFINVCAAGMFTNISQQVDLTFKNTFGKLAYYVKGVEQLPNFMPMEIKITTSKDVFVETVFLFFALNSAGTGGFSKLSPNAKIDDGLLDFIAVKQFPVHELPIFLIKTLSGDYFDDPRIIFFRDSYIKIEPTKEIDDYLKQTDIDGEFGPKLPIEIRNISRCFKIFMVD